jgi:hypothetical protein
VHQRLSYLRDSARRQSVRIFSDRIGRSQDEPWKLEKANLNLVADFVASLPGE